MCGIVGLMCPGGLTEAHVEKFVGMLKRCQTRGVDATGIFTSNMKMLKAPLPSQIFVTANKFKDFIAVQLQQGMTYIVGHTRQATRGDPKINSNNHPFAGTDNRFMLVHNGAVNCKKYDRDTTITDTYALVEAVNSFLGDGPVYNAVKSGFEDVELTALYNNSVIVVGHEGGVVFCKSRRFPLIIQEIQEKGLILFASTDIIMGTETNVVVDGVKKKRWEELNDEVIVSVDSMTGEIKRAFLATKVMPTYTMLREQSDVGDLDLNDFIKGPDGKWTRRSLDKALDDILCERHGVDSTVSSPVKKKKHKGRKKRRGKKKSTSSSTNIPDIAEQHNDDRMTLAEIDDLRDIDDADVEDFDADDRTVDCFDCTSCDDADDDDKLLLRIRQGTVNCNEFGYEMNASEARRCPFFVPK